MPRGSKYNDEIRVTKTRYPNGQHYYVVSTFGFNHGSFQETAEGFTPFGCRKPLRTRVEAARWVVYRASQHHLREAAKLAGRSDWPVVIDEGDNDCAKSA